MNDTNDMNEDLTRKAALLMERVGGSFAASIAKAWIVGDSSNKQRVYSAFPELFEKYAAWALEDSE
jgi:predicted RNA polymerase sigma factor